MKGYYFQVVAGMFLLACSPRFVAQMSTNVSSNSAAAKVQCRLREINSNPLLSDRGIVLDVAYTRILPNGNVLQIWLKLISPKLSEAADTTWQIEEFYYLGTEADDTVTAICDLGNHKACEARLAEIAIAAESSGPKALKVARNTVESLEAVKKRTDKSKPLNLKVANYDYRLHAWSKGSWNFIFAQDAALPESNYSVSVEASRFYVLWTNPKQ